jgi:DNA-binding GntR family transcriptional regulator
VRSQVGARCPGDEEDTVVGRQRTATERAYTHTKARILDGTYPTGELLTEGTVADAVGVSRTPVREAFLRLEAERLLHLFPKRGALVVPVSAQEVDDVMEVRQMIERFAIEKVIGRGRHAELGAAMRASVDRQEELLDSARRFTGADRDFHGLLVAATGNQVLIDLYRALRDRQLRMGISALKRDPERAAQILDEHRLLADALLTGDRDGALACIESHIHGTEQLLRGIRG